MQAFARRSIYFLASGVLLATSGCVVGPDRYHDQGYYNDGTYSQRDQRYREDDRDRDRHQAYERCREEGGRDCDDAYHR